MWGQREMAIGAAETGFPELRLGTRQKKRVGPFCGRPGGRRRAAAAYLWPARSLRDVATDCGTLTPALRRWVAPKVASQGTGIGIAVCRPTDDARLSRHKGQMMSVPQPVQFRQQSKLQRAGELHELAICLVLRRRRRGGRSGGKVKAAAWHEAPFHV
jgi:hypothetical protein